MAHQSRSSGDHPTRVERLARWALAIRDEDIPTASLRQAKLLVLDTLGCGVAALNDDTAKATVRLIGSMGGAPHCAVIGSRERTSLENAILANGVLVRTLDLNDYVVGLDGGIGGHPSDNIPMALATAEFAGRSGLAALAAIVVGYEVYDRVKSTMADHGAWDGVSATGAVAPIVVGRLLGLDVERLSQALALSLSYSAVSAVVRSGDISGAKSIANSFVAHHGARCALLARDGVTGPLSILDHPRGMRAVFSHIDEQPPLDAPMTGENYITLASVKAFPCVATGQAAVAAGVAMHKLLGGDLSGLERVVATMAEHPTIVAQQRDPLRQNPQSREAADHSFHFVIAVSLLDGVFGLDQYRNERWKDPQVVALMRRIELKTSADISARAGGRTFPCALEVFAKGERRHTEVLNPPGASDGGLDEGVVLRKFEGLAGARFSKSDRERLISQIMSMETSPQCAEAIDPIRLAAKA